MKEKPRFYISIDPGVSTGMAVWDTHLKEFTDIWTTDFWGCIAFIEKFIPDNVSCEVVIENPNGNKPVFFKKGVKSQAMARKVGQNIGSNKREASLLIEYMERYKIRYTAIVPKKKSTGSGKITQEYFRKLSGWTKRTNQSLSKIKELHYGDGNIHANRFKSDYLRNPAPSCFGMAGDLGVRIKPK